MLSPPPIPAGSATKRKENSLSALDRRGERDYNSGPGGENPVGEFEEKTRGAWSPEEEAQVMTQAVAAVEFPAVADGLAAYAAAVRAIPRLSAAEEARLAAAYRDGDDVECARQLALANLRDVMQIADGYSGYGLPRADLIQEGNLGLLRAIHSKRFEPERELRFITFAQHWVHAAIREFVVRNWRIVKIATTKAQRKLFFKMRRLTARGADGRLESAEAIADAMHVRPQDVRDMRERLAATVAAPLDGDEENPGAAAYLAAPREQTDVEERAVAAFERDAGRLALREALAGLPKRDREILAARRLAEPPATLQTLADRFAISAERVRQVENRAMAKVAEVVRARLAAA